MSWEILTFIVAVIAAGAAIVYGEIQRRAAQKQRRLLVLLQLKLAQQQAEAHPNIKVSWATPKIKYQSHLLEQAKLRLQIQNTGKVAAHGVYLTLCFDQNHLEPISDSSWALGTLYPTPPAEPATREVAVSISSPESTKVRYSIISEESSSEGDLEIADLRTLFS
jgi:hypothetical protein